MNDMKCPVCQNNLHKINIIVSTCTNDKCKLWGSSIPNLVLEALAQTKQDLDRTKKELNDIESKHEKLLKNIAMRGNREQELRNKFDICVDALKDIAFGGVREISDENLRLTNIAIKALEQINNKEQNDA